MHALGMMCVLLSWEGNLEGVALELEIRAEILPLFSAACVIFSIQPLHFLAPL